MLLLLVFRRGLCALRLVVVVVGLHAFPRPMIESERNIGCLSPPIVDPLRLRSKKNIKKVLSRILKLEFHTL